MGDNKKKREEITDPAILEQLNSGDKAPVQPASKKVEEVTDPSVLAQLNSESPVVEKKSPDVSASGSEQSAPSAPVTSSASNLWSADKSKYVDSVLGANKHLNWVQRLYDKNPETISVPGEDSPSTHLMGDNGNGYVFPRLQKVNGKLTDLGDRAEDYARETNSGIQLPKEQGTWFANNGYKTGSDVLSGSLEPEERRKLLGAPNTQDVVNNIFGKDISGNPIINTTTHKSPPPVDPREETNDAINTLASHVVQNALPQYEENLKNTPFTQPGSVVHDITDPHGDPQMTGSYARYGIEQLRLQRQHEIAQLAQSGGPTDPDYQEKADAINSKYNEQISALQNAGMHITSLQLASREYAAKKYTPAEGQQMIDDLHKEYKKELETATGGGDVNIAKATYEKAKAEIKKNTKYDAVRLGMEQQKMLGNKTASEDLVKYNNGQPLPDDRKVAYQLNGLNILQIGARNAAANNQLDVAKNMDENSDNIQERLEKDNPKYFRDLYANRIGSYLYNNENYPIFGTFFARGVPSKEKIKAAGEAVGLTPEQIMKVRPEEIPTMASALGEFAQGAFNAFLFQDDKDPYGELFTGKVPQEQHSFNNWRGILGEMSSGAGTIAGFVAQGGIVGEGLKGTELLGNVAKNAKRYETTANLIPLAISNYNNSYQASKEVIGDKPQDELKRQMYSVLNATLGTAIMSVDPATALGKDALGMTSAGRDIVNVIKEGGLNMEREAFRDKMKRIISQGITASGETAKHAGSQALIMATNKAAENVTDMFFDPEHRHGIMDNTGQAALQAGIAMFLPSLAKGLRTAGEQSPANKAIIWDVAKNADKYRSQVAELYKQGKMTDEEYQTSIGSINKAQSVFKTEVPEVSDVTNEPLTNEQKQAYGANLLQEKELESQLEGSTDKVRIAAINQYVKALQAQRQDILNEAGYRPTMDENTIKLADVIGKKVLHNGELSTVSVDDANRVIVTNDVTGREYDNIGNVNIVGRESIKNHGIEEVHTPTVIEDQGQSVVSVAASGNVNVRGKEYTLPEEHKENPLGAINYNNVPGKKGVPASVTLEQKLPSGGVKKVTFRGNVAEDIMYQLHLQKLEKENSYGKLEKFINTDPEVNAQIQDGRSAQAPEEAAVGDNGKVPEPKAVADEKKSADKSKEELSLESKQQKPVENENETIRLDNEEGASISSSKNSETNSQASSPEGVGQRDEEGLKPTLQESKINEGGAETPPPISVSGRRKKKPLMVDAPSVEAEVSKPEAKEAAPVASPEINTPTPKDRIGDYLHENKLEYNTDALDHADGSRTVGIHENGEVVNGSFAKYNKAELKEFKNLKADLELGEITRPEYSKKLKELDKKVLDRAAKDSDLFYDHIDAVRGNSKETSAPNESAEVKARVPVAAEEQNSDVPAEEKKEVAATGSEANRKRGAFEKDGIVYIRNEKQEGPTGSEGTIEFSKGVDKPFTYQLVESSKLQTASKDGNRNPNHFIPEAQPKQRTDAASKESAERIADKPDLGKVGESPNAYSGAPVVNPRGEVIQGNNRAEGLVKHYENKGADYKKQLSENAAKYGLTKEQVEAMENPVLVRRLDVGDEEAIRLGNYDVKDIETGGKNRIDPVATSRRIPLEDKNKIIKAVIQEGEDKTLNQALRDSYDRVIKLLKDHLRPAQLDSLISRSGEPIPDGLADVEKLITHFLFDGAEVEAADHFEGLSDAARKGLIKAFPKIFGVSAENSLLPEIQNALGAHEDFKTSGNPSFNSWKNQGDMFAEGRTPADTYLPIELKLAELFSTVKTQKEISELLAKFAQKVNGVPADMFGEGVEPMSKSQAVEEVFKTPYDEKQSRLEREKAEAAKLEAEANRAPVFPEAGIEPGEAPKELTPPDEKAEAVPETRAPERTLSAIDLDLKKQRQSQKLEAQKRSDAEKAGDIPEANKHNDNWFKKQERIAKLEEERDRLLEDQKDTTIKKRYNDLADRWQLQYENNKKEHKGIALGGIIGLSTKIGDRVADYVVSRAIEGLRELGNIHVAIRRAIRLAKEKFGDEAHDLSYKDVDVIKDHLPDFDTAPESEPVLPVDHEEYAKDLLADINDGKLTHDEAVKEILDEVILNREGNPVSEAVAEKAKAKVINYLKWHDSDRAAHNASLAEPGAKDNILSQYSLTEGDAMSKFLSGKTIEDVTGDKPLNDQQVVQYKLPLATVDAEKMVSLVKHHFGTDIAEWAPEMIRQIDGLPGGDTVKRVTALLGLMDELRKDRGIYEYERAQLIGGKDTERIKEVNRYLSELPKILRAAEKSYQDTQREASKTLNAGRIMSKLFRGYFTHELHADEAVLSPAQRETKTEFEDKESTTAIPDKVAQEGVIRDEKTADKEIEEAQEKIAPKPVSKGKSAVERLKERGEKKSQKDKEATARLKEEAVEKLAKKGMTPDNMFEKIKELIKKNPC